MRLILGLGEPRKYQFMEQNLQRRVGGLRDKLPDIRKTLETVQFLKLRTVRGGTKPLYGAGGADGDISWQSESDPIETTFELNDTLYAKAEIPPTDEVYLWLGVRPLLHLVGTGWRCGSEY